MMKKLLFCTLLTAIGCSTMMAQRPWKHETFQTDTPMVHDPVMAYENGMYHIYATGMGIQHMTSADRKTWTVHKEPVMSVIPKWTRDSVPGFEHHVWAPDIINAIDPCFVIDDEDQPWLVWGSFWDGIQLCRLDTTMHTAAGEQPRTIARRYPAGYQAAEPNPTSKFAGTNAIEAPFIMKHDGWYYLFVAWDYCCRGIKSNYKVVVGRSQNVAGPYVDKNGKPMTEGGGTIVIEGDKKEYEAAGHCAAYHINGEDLFICHGYYIPRKGASILVQRNINWKDGWPEI